MFVFIAAAMVGGTRLFGFDYLAALNLRWFCANAADGLLGLFTLTYVPNYFDILPMYVGALAMVPAVMALARLHPAAALASCTALYAANWGYGWGLPAEPGSERDRKGVV